VTSSLDNSTLWTSECRREGAPGLAMGPVLFAPQVPMLPLCKVHKGLRTGVVMVLCGSWCRVKWIQEDSPGMYQYFIKVSGQMHRCRGHLCRGGPQCSGRCHRTVHWDEDLRCWQHVPSGDVPSPTPACADSPVRGVPPCARCPPCLVRWCQASTRTSTGRQCPPIRYSPAPQAGSQILSLVAA